MVIADPVLGVRVTTKPVILVKLPTPVLPALPKSLAPLPNVSICTKPLIPPPVDAFGIISTGAVALVAPVASPVLVRATVVPPLALTVASVSNAPVPVLPTVALLTKAAL